MAMLSSLGTQVDSKMENETFGMVINDIARYFHVLTIVNMRYNSSIHHFWWDFKSFEISKVETSGLQATLSVLNFSWAISGVVTYILVS